MHVRESVLTHCLWVQLSQSWQGWGRSRNGWNSSIYAQRMLVQAGRNSHTLHTHTNKPANRLLPLHHSPSKTTHVKRRMQPTNIVYIRRHPSSVQAHKQMPACTNKHMYVSTLTILFLYIIKDLAAHHPYGFKRTVLVSLIYWASIKSALLWRVITVYF